MSLILSHLSVSNNELEFDQSVYPISTNAFDYEPSICPVSVGEPTYELSTRSKVPREIIDELFAFSASVLDAMDALSVSCVLVFPRSQSLPWVSAPSALSWWTAAPPWWSSAPSAPPWWASALPWRSSAPSAPPWWASAPPWRSSAPSALPWWASAPTWRSSAPSAPPWWASALPWGSSDLSALLWWSSTPLVLPAPSWYPVLPVLPQSQGLRLQHGPGPPSLPLFRLRSTALLVCTVFGASGSRSLGGGGGGLCHETCP